MPTYEYECQKCGKQFELVQSIKESALRFCRKEFCRKRAWGKGRVRRLLSSGAGLIFKGTGFYITDYRSESYKQAAKKESEAASPKKDAGTAGSKKESTTAGGTSQKSTKTKET